MSKSTLYSHCEFSAQIKCSKTDINIFQFKPCWPKSVFCKVYSLCVGYSLCKMAQFWPKFLNFLKYLPKSILYSIGVILCKITRNVNKESVVNIPEMRPC